ncbi:MAG UNVERIFIED_CONTAM: FAD-binding protein [Anaerolineae bacterium]|jgi:FAD/FMN-containing dehydrogenase
MVSTVPASPSPTTTALVEQLMAHIQGDVLASDLDRAIYSTDASMYRVLPRCVVAPRDTADIVQTLQLVHAHHSSIIPRGGGTSLSGQSVGTGWCLICLSI